MLLHVQQKCLGGRLQHQRSRGDAAQALLLQQEGVHLCAALGGGAGRGRVRDWCGRWARLGMHRFLRLHCSWHVVSCQNTKQRCQPYTWAARCSNPSSCRSTHRLGLLELNGRRRCAQRALPQPCIDQRDCHTLAAEVVSGCRGEAAARLQHQGGCRRRRAAEAAVGGWQAAGSLEGVCEACDSRATTVRAAGGAPASAGQRLRPRQLRVGALSCPWLAQSASTGE